MAEGQLWAGPGDDRAAPNPGPPLEVRTCLDALAENVELAHKSFAHLLGRIETVLLPADTPSSQQDTRGYGSPLAQALDSILQRLVELHARIDGVTHLVQL